MVLCASLRSALTAYHQSLCLCILQFSCGLFYLSLHNYRLPSSANRTSQFGHVWCGAAVRWVSLTLFVALRCVVSSSVPQRLTVEPLKTSAEFVNIRTRSRELLPSEISSSIIHGRRKNFQFSYVVACLSS